MRLLADQRSPLGNRRSDDETHTASTATNACSMMAFCSALLRMNGPNPFAVSQTAIDATTATDDKPSPCFIRGPTPGPVRPRPPPRRGAPPESPCRDRRYRARSPPLARLQAGCVPGTRRRARGSGDATVSLPVVSMPTAHYERGKSIAGILAADVEGVRVAGLRSRVTGAAQFRFCHEIFRSTRVRQRCQIDAATRAGSGSDPVTAPGVRKVQ